MENLQQMEYVIAPIAENAWIIAMRNVIRLAKTVHGMIAKSASAANIICTIFTERTRDIEEIVRLKVKEAWIWHFRSIKRVILADGQDVGTMGEKIMGAICGL